MVLMFLVSLFLTPSIFALDVDIQCGELEDELHWTGYCLHQVPESTSTHLVYYLHGIGGSEYEWSDSRYFEEIYTRWGKNAPKVLSVSYGPQWLLAEKNDSAKSGLFEHFTKTVLPALETRLNLKPDLRMAFGASMGGFNSAQLYLKSPRLFSKVALACPAITRNSPYDSPEKIADYIVRTHADPEYVFFALAISREYFPDVNAWAQSSPIAQAKFRVTPEHPALHVSCGDEDEYGFFEGAKELVATVTSRGGKAKWQLVEGNHCTFDPDEIADFLNH